MSVQREEEEKKKRCASASVQKIFGAQQDMNEARQLVATGTDPAGNDVWPRLRELLPQLAIMSRRYLARMAQTKGFAELASRITTYDPSQEPLKYTRDWSLLRKAAQLEEYLQRPGLNEENIEAIKRALADLGRFTVDAEVQARLAGIAARAGAPFIPKPPPAGPGVTPGWGRSTYRDVRTGEEWIPSATLRKIFGTNPY